MDGDTAVQESNLICTTQYQDRWIQPELLVSHYKTTYVRTSDGWKIKNLRLQQCYSVPVQGFIPAGEKELPKPTEVS